MFTKKLTTKHKNTFLSVYLIACLMNSLCMFSFAQEQKSDAPASAPAQAESTAPSGSKQSPLSFWLALGPTLVAANEKNFGLRTALGMDVFADDARRFFVGFLVSKPFVGEHMDGRFSGTVNRTYLLPNAGIYIIPKHMWSRLGIGLGYLTGSNPDVTAKLKTSYLLELGYKVPLNQNWDVGAAFSFEYSGQAKNSIAFIVDSISCAFGDCELGGTIPKAAIWSTSLVVGYNL